jgi:hypothetical protein
MRNKDEIENQISIAIDIEATYNSSSSIQLFPPAAIRAEGIREALDWVMEQQDQPPFEDE